MSGDYAVRPAREDDAPAVHRVRQRAIRTSAAGFYDADAVEDWAAGGSVRAACHKIATMDGFVAVADGRVVGWAALDGTEVSQLYVDPDHGGRGVARRLYTTIEGHASAHGTARLTTVASRRSMPVFQRFGFTEVRREDRPFGGHNFEVADMAKRLDPAVCGRSV